MPARPVLLDTCAAIWLAGGVAMSGLSLQTIAAARSSGAGVYVSAISAWEIGMLTAKGRLRLSMTPEAWFAALLSLPSVRLAELTPEILFASCSLPGQPPTDPADRIIAATARSLGLTLITRDDELGPYAAAGYIAAIGC
jgi:PIN domain nuclease of toxin-antitoxin system